MDILCKPFFKCRAFSQIKFFKKRYLYKIEKKNGQPNKLWVNKNVDKNCEKNYRTGFWV